MLVPRKKKELKNFQHLPKVIVQRRRNVNAIPREKILNKKTL